MWSSVCAMLVVLATIARCNSLRMRRSGVAGYDDPYGLTNALGIMERTQRANYNSLLNRGYPSEEDSYFNPNSGTEYELSPIDYLSAIGYDKDADDALSEYMYGRPMASRRAYGEIPILVDDEEDTVGYGPQKRTAFNPKRVVPTLDELRTLFGEADVPMKRLAPVKRRQPELEPAMKSEDSASNEKADLSKQWGKLINAAEQLTLNKIDEEKDETESDSTHDDSDNTGNTLQDELNDAFKDADVDDAGNSDQTVEETNEFIEKNNQPQSKSKRASSGIGDTSDYIIALLKDISDLKEKVSILEMKQLLEDRENDFLANALKYSTLDQMNGDDEFVENEYSDIAKATKIEELIQDFSDAVEDEDENSDEEDEISPAYGAEFSPEVDSDLETIKRSDDDNEDDDDETEGEWLDSPVEERVTGEAYLKDDDDDLTESDPMVGPYVDDDTDDVTENDVMENAIAGDLSGRQEHASGGDKGLLLARLINNLSPETVQEILADLENKASSIDENNNEYCPAVMDLSQNCAFADERDIPLDDEARNLCIRHQLCYTCGEALGIPPNRCDGGYKGTVLAECRGDVTCVRSAADFLRLMTSQYHVYEPYSPEQCLNSCVKDFIYGV